MDKILDLLKRRLIISKITDKRRDSYFVNVNTSLITEEEYNLMLEFLNSEEKENEQHN